MKRKSIVLALCLMLMMVFVGCGKEVAEEDSTSLASEVEFETVLEPVYEEVSEPVSEEPSEEVAEEIAPEVEFVNFSNLDELVAYSAELNQTIIVEFDFSVDGSTQAIIPNGSNYTMQLGERLRVIAIKEVESIDTNVDGIGIMEGTTQNVWVVGVYNSGTDMEVSFTVKYTDGTSEDFTIYVTRE